MMISFLKNLIQKLNRVEIYTDGSHKGRWGSWAYVVVKRGKIIREASGRERRTNSHRMEFQAAIEALRGLPRNTKAVLYTDSRVLLNAMKQEPKRALTNEDQVEILEVLKEKHHITWTWIKAHAGHIYNERCDQLCIKVRNT